MSMDAYTVTTGEVRLSYVHLFKPHAFQQGQEEKYRVTVLVPKTDTDTMARINAAIEAAKQKGVSDKWNGRCPAVLSMPINDGDGARPSDGEPYGPECRGHWVINTSAKVDQKPEVVDAGGSPIIDQSQVYSGMYGRVNMRFAPYSFGSKCGVGCYLGPVQKLRDGEVLGGGRVSAAQAFGTPIPQQPQMSAIAGMPVQQQQAPVYGTAGIQVPQAQPAPQAPAGGINPITGMPY